MPEENYLMNALFNKLGIGPQQQWQGLLQSLQQSGLFPQYQPAAQVPTVGGQNVFTPQGAQNLGNAWLGGEPGAGQMPSGQPAQMGMATFPAQGLNLNALGSLQNPQQMEMVMKLLGQQSMSPLEQAQTKYYQSRAGETNLLTPAEQREKELYGQRERPKQLPPQVTQAIQKGRDVIKRGANPWKVYNEIVADYPEYGLEIQRALVSEEKNKTTQDLIQQLLSR